MKAASSHTQEAWHSLCARIAAWFPDPDHPSRHDRRLQLVRPDLAASGLEDRAPKSACLRRPVLKRIVAGTAAIYNEPSTAGPAADEALFGEDVLVMEERGGWAWGQLMSDAYVGYLDARTLAPVSCSPTHRISHLFTHLLAGPDIQSAMIALLPFGARVTVVERSDDGRYARIAERDAWIATQHIRPLDEPVDSPLAVARRYLGAPYRWGGRTAAGIDCSGLIQMAFLFTDLPLPRDSDLQLATMQGPLGARVAPDAARRGDLVFFPAHVGIMVDERHVLHANATHMMVTIDPLGDVLGWLEAKGHARPLVGIYRPAVCMAAD
ncbi:MAG: hypothetical protein D6740_05290 [Alphaproteobacteria bacterium]|nr:MAG: hypothetical protein D6740_05290 [Alphaproteobacteria bacterium]